MATNPEPNLLTLVARVASRKDGETGASPVLHSCLLHFPAACSSVRMYSTTDSLQPSRSLSFAQEEIQERYFGGIYSRSWFCLSRNSD